MYLLNESNVVLRALFLPSHGDFVLAVKVKLQILRENIVYLERSAVYNKAPCSRRLTLQMPHLSIRLFQSPLSPVSSLFFLQSSRQVQPNSDHHHSQNLKQSSDPANTFPQKIKLFFLDFINFLNLFKI